MRNFMRTCVVVAIVVGLVCVAVFSSAFAAPGALLATVALPNNGSCNVAGTLVLLNQRAFYVTVQGDNCSGTTLGFYTPPAGLGNQTATLVATKSVVDANNSPVTVSALSWDSKRGKLWAAFANDVYLIDIGDPTVSGNARAVLQFHPNVGGIGLIDGLAYDRGSDTLFHSPDVDMHVYEFGLGDVNPLGLLLRTVTPKNSSGVADGLVSGVAIGASNTLYIGRDGDAEIRRINKTTGDFVSEFATTSGRVESLVCDPVTYTPREAILAKDAFNALYEAFEVEPNTCPLGNSKLTIFPPSSTLARTSDFGLTLIVELPPTVTIAGGKATLDGHDVTAALVSCFTAGRLSLPRLGQTLRCPGLNGGVIGVGVHFFDVFLDLSNGDFITDTARWEILPNTEP